MLSVNVTFHQTVPKRDMLYLDKAWRHLQELTAPASGEPVCPAYRMFEGAVTMHDRGWDAWVRPLVPDEISVIARDLESISDDAARSRFRQEPCVPAVYRLVYSWHGDDHQGIGAAS